MKYKVEVLCHGETTWVSNGLRFDTEEEAKEYALDLFSHWTAVDEYRVVEEATS